MWLVQGAAKTKNLLIARNVPFNFSCVTMGYPGFSFPTENESGLHSTQLGTNYDVLEATILGRNDTHGQFWMILGLVC